MFFWNFIYLLLSFEKCRSIFDDLQDLAPAEGRGGWNFLSYFLGLYGQSRPTFGQIFFGHFSTSGATLGEKKIEKNENFREGVWYPPPIPYPPTPYPPMVYRGVSHRGGAISDLDIGLRKKFKNVKTIGYGRIVFIIGTKNFFFGLIKFSHGILSYPP